MRIKIDENLSRHMREEIIALGHDVTSAYDEGLLSRSDSEIAAAAAREDRVLLTLDLEFGDLRKHPPGQHPGIILFRPQFFGRRAVSRFVTDFLRETALDELSGCVVVVDPGRIRVRRPPIDFSGPEWETYEDPTH